MKFSRSETMLRKYKFCTVSVHGNESFRFLFRNIYLSLTIFIPKISRKLSLNYLFQILGVNKPGQFLRVGDDFSLADGDLYPSTSNYPSLRHEFHLAIDVCLVQSTDLMKFVFNALSRY